MPPIDDAIITVRSQSKHSNAIRQSASPSGPSIASPGTRQSTSAISAVGEDRQPILSSSRPTLNPGLGSSTRNADADFSPVFARTVQTSAIGPLVMKIFVPLSTQSAPSRTAVVRRPAESDPASGSVEAQAPIHVPSQSDGR